MHNARNKQTHDKRRRTWDKGFNAKCECRGLGFHAFPWSP